MSDKFYDDRYPVGDDGEEKTELLSDLPEIKDNAVTELLENAPVGQAAPITDPDQGDAVTQLLNDAADPYTAAPAPAPAAEPVRTGYPMYGAPYGYANPYEQPTTPLTTEPFTAPYGDAFSAPQDEAPQAEEDAVHRTYHDGFTAQSSDPVRADESKNPYETVEKEPAKKAKKRKAGKISGATVAILLIVCILVSAAAGFGGSMLASRVNKGSGSGYEGEALKINMVDTESVDYEKLQDKTTTEITSEVADTVVEITTESMQTSSFYGQYISQGAGSGVIIDSNGYILTNNHVISGASSIKVTTRSGDMYDATLVGTDSEVDIALIKVEATDLPAATFGDSSKLEVGSKAVIIGNPLGTLGGSVTEGIISALDRSIVIDGKTMHLMQTDAAINPGNSGGGMFDGQGLLSGIVVAKSSSEEIDNIGFVIPINNVLEILDSLKKDGYVRGRAETGMTFIDLSNAMFAYYYYRSTEAGVYITSVNMNSNAAKAGFMEGDRVVSVDGKEIKTADDINEIISEKSAGDSVDFEISRRGSSKTISLTLEEKIPDDLQQNNSSNNNPGEYFEY